MRVFVTGTGRCGTVSFWAACKHIRNYTAGHETPCGLLQFPDNHIEVNPQLRQFITLVVRNHPDSFWVHMVRDRDACAKSLAALNSGNWLRQWFQFVDTMRPCLQQQVMAERAYDGIVQTIDAVLSATVQPEQRMVFRLEQWARDWPRFCERIGAEGDMQAAMKTWETPRNTSKERGDAK